MVSTALFTQRPQPLSLIEEHPAPDSHSPAFSPSPEEKRRTADDPKRRTQRLKPLLPALRVPSLPSSPFQILPLHRNILISLSLNEKHRIKVRVTDF
jgi:hypothetical protein